MMIIGLLWALIVLGFAGLYVAVFVPQKMEMAKVCDELDKVKAECERAKKIADERNVQKQTEELEALKERLREFAVDYEAVSDVTLAVSSLAKSQNVGSFSIRSGGGEINIELPNCDYIWENRFEVSFEGNFLQFAMLLNALERSEPVVFIDEFSISRAREDVKNPVEMNLAVLVRRPVELSKK